MKIQCPSGDIKEMDECLKCSKCYPAPMKKALLGGRERTKKNHIKPKFGVTRLVSECLRKSYFELTEEVPISLEKLWIFSRGHAIHNFFQKSMKPENVEIFNKKEFAMFELIGFVDAIEDGILYEFKTTANIPQSPQEHHVLQAQAYFSLLSEEEQQQVQKINIIYFSLNNIVVFEVPKRNILQLLEAKGTILAQALKSGTAPRKQDSWLCDLCEYKEFCTGEKATTYDAAKAMELTKDAAKKQDVAKEIGLELIETNGSQSNESETESDKQKSSLKKFF